MHAAMFNTHNNFWRIRALWQHSVQPIRKLFFDFHIFTSSVIDNVDLLLLHSHSHALSVLLLELSNRKESLCTIAGFRTDCGFNDETGAA